MTLKGNIINYIDEILELIKLKYLYVIVQAAALPPYENMNMYSFSEFRVIVLDDGTIQYEQLDKPRNAEAIVFTVDKEKLVNDIELGLDRHKSNIGKYTFHDVKLSNSSHSSYPDKDGLVFGLSLRNFNLFIDILDELPNNTAIGYLVYRSLKNGYDRLAIKIDGLYYLWDDITKTITVNTREDIRKGNFSEFSASGFNFITLDKLSYTFKDKNKESIFSSYCLTETEASQIKELCKMLEEYRTKFSESMDLIDKAPSQKICKEPYRPDMPEMTIFSDRDLDRAVELQRDIDAGLYDEPVITYKDVKSKSLMKADSKVDTMTSYYIKSLTGERNKIASEAYHELLAEIASATKLADDLKLEMEEHIKRGYYMPKEVAEDDSYMHEDDEEIDTNPTYGGFMNFIEDDGDDDDVLPF